MMANYIIQSANKVEFVVTFSQEDNERLQHLAILPINYLRNPYLEMRQKSQPALNILKQLNPI